MRIANNYSFSTKQSNVSVRNITVKTNNQSYNENLSFGANFNKPKKGIIDFLLSPFKRMIEKNKEKARLKYEAEEAERKAAILAQKKALMARKKEIKLAADEYLNNWRAKYRGVFDSRKIIDNTGDIEISAADRMKSTQIPKMKYSLLNLSAAGYQTKPCAGACNWLLKDDNRGLYVNSLAPYSRGDDKDVFYSGKWFVKYDESNRLLQEFNTGMPAKVTVLSCGWIDSTARALNRFPGVNIVIEGEIPYKDICAIKKNIVEKGLWDNFKEKQDDDAITGIFNEIINYLNR